MEPYRCNCARCRSRGLVAPALLITLGMLFLLDQFHYVNFGRSWPVFLIVIGLVKVWQSTTSLEGHVQNYVRIPEPATQSIVPSQDPNSGQVHHG
jgi:hypothetical protein